MQIAQILKNKGDRVVTTRPDATIGAVVQTLRSERIGALVVADETGDVVGIISERDIVRGMPEHGAALFNMCVADLMTRDVITCAPEDPLVSVMQEMTEGRFRHLPVLRDGTLIGIVSIGDAVKSRLQELETETSQLREYIAG